MKLEIAIEELSFWETRFHDYNDPKMSKAVQLGIEALKRLKEIRADPCAYNVRMLPGETEE